MTIEISFRLIPLHPFLDLGNLRRMHYSTS